MTHKKHQDDELPPEELDEQVAESGKKPGNGNGGPETGIVDHMYAPDATPGGPPPGTAGSPHPGDGGEKLLEEEPELGGGGDEIEREQSEEEGVGF